MKNRFYRMLLIYMAVLALCAGAAAEEKHTAFLGKPFPDFTVTDTEGNTFTLSEALKDHEAVLINFWTTWCFPCRMEFPFLNEAYEQYGDRVAFIALSGEKNDTAEKIAFFRRENRILFPMGRDEDTELYGYIEANGFPATVIVDRFGNAVFCHDSTFVSAAEIGRVLEVFLGDGYTQSKTLEKIPQADAAPAENAPQAYILHVLDQDDNPVEEVSVNFCTDTACVPKESDEDGLIIFSGAPDAYHLQVIDLPDGYSLDGDFDMYTPREYGEWILRIRKD